MPLLFLLFTHKLGISFLTQCHRCFVCLEQYCFRVYYTLLTLLPSLYLSLPPSLPLSLSRSPPSPPSLHLQPTIGHPGGGWQGEGPPVAGVGEGELGEGEMEVVGEVEGRGKDTERDDNVAAELAAVQGLVPCERSEFSNYSATIQCLYGNSTHSHNSVEPLYKDTPEIRISL